MDVIYCNCHHIRLGGDDSVGLSGQRPVVNRLRNEKKTKITVTGERRRAYNDDQFVYMATKAVGVGTLPIEQRPS